MKRTKFSVVCKQRSVGATLWQSTGTTKNGKQHSRNIKPSKKAINVWIPLMIFLLPLSLFRWKMKETKRKNRKTKFEFQFKLRNNDTETSGWANCDECEFNSISIRWVECTVAAYSQLLIDLADVVGSTSHAPMTMSMRHRKALISFDYAMRGKINHLRRRFVHSTGKKRIRQWLTRPSQLLNGGTLKGILA